MEKTIKITKDKSLKLSNNIGWLMIYKNQFGHDIMLSIMPAISSLVKLLADTIDDVYSDGKVDIKAISPEAIDEALIDLSGLELTDFIEIIWAMAKSADDDIEDPDEWIKQFEVFPLDLIVPEAAGMIVKGFVSSKNLKRIQTAMKSLNPKSTSTPSSSQASKEE